jgi:hypothetical protein
VKLKLRISILFLFVLSSCYGLDWEKVETSPPVFDGQNAYEQVAYQVSMGPRFPGSEGHEKVQVWIKDELKRYGWTVEYQVSEFQGKPINNIVAYRQDETLLDQDWIILGAHYDTRMVADQDPDPNLQSEPVIGANDGASGVAVLLELARILPMFPNTNVWLVFFDAEDNGGVPGWNWIMGSLAFVENLSHRPDKVVIVDMVGDADQNIYIEKSSDPELAAEIWQAAADLGIDSFIAEPKYQILDDHTPFLMNEIPAVDIIDFSYPFWHTTQDTLDKVNAQSLKNVGDVLLYWLIQNQITKE